MKTRRRARFFEKIHSRIDLGLRAIHGWVVQKKIEIQLLLIKRGRRQNTKLARIDDLIPDKAKVVCFGQGKTFENF